MERCFILDVGHGNSAVVQGATRVAVIDAGAGSDTLDFLERRDISNVDVVVVSHADADHVGGLLALIAKLRSDTKFSIGTVYINPDPRSTTLWDDVAFALDVLDRAGRLKLIVETGVGAPEHEDLGGCAIEMIAPSKYARMKGVTGKLGSNAKMTANGLSAVVRVLHGDRTWVILPGDLDYAGFQQACKDVAWPPAPLIVFPHHGGQAGSLKQTESLAIEIITATNPQFVVFSARGRDQRFPSQLVVDAILGLTATPNILSIGVSPVIATAIEKMDPCAHINGFGTVVVLPPDATGLVKVCAVN